MIKRKFVTAEDPSKKKKQRRDEASSDDESAQHTTSQGTMLVDQIDITDQCAKIHLSVQSGLSH